MPIAAIQNTRVESVLTFQQHHCIILWVTKLKCH